MRTSDGQSIAIDNRCANARAARGKALDEIHRVLRERTDVGDATLGHRLKGALAFDEIERVGVDAGRIAVVRRGKKRWTWTSIRTDDNSLLLLEELSARGVTTSGPRWGRVQLER